MYLFRRMTYILPLTYQLLAVVACNCVSLKRHLHPVAPRASAACHSRLYISREDHLQAVVPHVSATYHNSSLYLWRRITYNLQYLIRQILATVGYTSLDHLHPVAPHVLAACYSSL
jgi:hypothetical protein